MSLRLGKGKIKDVLRRAEEEWLEIAEEAIRELEKEIPNIREILWEELAEKKTQGEKTGRPAESPDSSAGGRA